MGFYTETMCTFKTATMFYICTTIKKSEYRIPTNLRKLESTGGTWNSHWKRKLFMQEQKRVRIKMQNGCEEHRKGIKANHIR